MTNPPRFILLTQDHCPGCERLKLMLKGPLKGAFDTQIETVHRESTASEFERWAEQYQIQATPALIDRESGEVMRTPGGLGEVKNFLSR